MAAADRAEQDPSSDEGEQQCTPCRGTGALTSNLGGEPHTVRCPWCGGSGVRRPGVDAQAEGPAEQLPAPERG